MRLFLDVSVGCPPFPTDWLISAFLAFWPFGFFRLFGFSWLLPSTFWLFDQLAANWLFLFRLFDWYLLLYPTSSLIFVNLRRSSSMFVCWLFFAPFRHVFEWSQLSCSIFLCNWGESKQLIQSRSIQSSLNLSDFLSHLNEGASGLGTPTCLNATYWVLQVNWLSGNVFDTSWETSWFDYSVGTKGINIDKHNFAGKCTFSYIIQRLSRHTKQFE